MSHTVEILSVGTELLLGNIVNLDAQILSQGLSALGLNVYWHTVVGDNPQRAREAVAIAKKVAESMDAYMKALPADNTPDPYADIPVFSTPTSDVLAKQGI